MTFSVLIAGGAGYVGSHTAYAVRLAGLEPVVIDNLSSGNAWAASFGPFEQGDIGDPEFVRAVCEKYQPSAAMHFADIPEDKDATDPAPYIDNNRDKTARFFKTLNACGVKRAVFSSSAAVYGDVSAHYVGVGGKGRVTELYPTRPLTPYAKAKQEAEVYVRMFDSVGLRSATLRYFNAAGAAPVEAQIGEAHAPETHLIPSLVLPLVDTPASLLRALGLQTGFTVRGGDFLTPDGTAVRDFVHVMDIADAHVRALAYLMHGGQTDAFNIGCGLGFSIGEIVAAARKALDRPNFAPGIAPRRDDDPPVLAVTCDKARDVLSWRPARSLLDIVADAAAWHRSSLYRDAIQAKLGIDAP